MEYYIAIKGKKHAAIQMSPISIEKPKKQKQSMIIWGEGIHKWLNYKGQRNYYHNSGFLWVGVKVMTEEDHVREGDRVL